MGWRKTKRAAGEALETAGKLADTHERIGAWFAAFGAIGAGVLLWIAPGSMAEEIPVHEPVGVAFGAFGLITLLALALRGNAGYRARSLLMVVLAALVGGALAWWMQGAARDVWALHESGEYRSVEVLGTKLKVNAYDKSRTPITEVRVEGERVTVDLDYLPKRGERADVLVAAERPRAIVPGHVEQDWLPLIEAVMGRWTALWVGLIVLFCALTVPVKLWDVLFGAPAGVDPDEDRP